MSPLGVLVHMLGEQGWKLALIVFVAFLAPRLVTAIKNRVR